MGGTHPNPSCSAALEVPSHPHRVAANSEDPKSLIFECQAFSYLRADTVQTLLALAEDSVRNFAADEDVCTVYTFMFDCMKIVDDEVVPAA